MGGVARYWLSGVIARRFGEAVFPVDVVTSFRDGQKMTERWDGTERRIVYTYERPSQALSAQVDPDRVLLLADATFPPQLTEIETSLFGESGGTLLAEKELILLRRDGSAAPSGTAEWLAAQQRLNGDRKLFGQLIHQTWNILRTPENQRAARLLVKALLHERRLTGKEVKRIFDRTRNPKEKPQSHLNQLKQQIINILHPKLAESRLAPMKANS